MIFNLQTAVFSEVDVRAFAAVCKGTQAYWNGSNMVVTVIAFAWRRERRGVEV